jgi:AcrR family transcriptional regulator
MMNRMSEVKRRSYSSPLREGMADETRRRVVASALEVFLERGFAATTVDRIASQAGVSRPTVFAVGSKAVLFKLARDRAIAGDDEDRPIVERPEYRRFVEETDPEQALRHYAALSAAIGRRFGPLNEILRQGAATEPELAELWETSERERLEGARGVVRAVAKKGALKPGLDAATAADVLWLLMAPDNERRLVDGRGWSYRRFERWYADTLVRLLLP